MPRSGLAAFRPGAEACRVHAEDARVESDDTRRLREEGRVQMEDLRRQSERERAAGSGAGSQWLAPGLRQAIRDEVELALKRSRSGEDGS